MRTAEEALADILSVAAPLGVERVALDVARGRVLRQDVRAPRTLPPWDNSAMDGYAVRVDDVIVGHPLPVLGTIAAGQAPGTLPPSGVLRIMTGAPLPAGADAVIMREEATEAAGVVAFARAPRRGQFVRAAGEDLRAGDVALAAGATLGAGELGLLAALSRTLVLVTRRPQVAILSTGDELAPADQPPEPGQIVDSNSHQLAALVAEVGGEPRVLAAAADTRESLAAALAEALRADVVLTSGGVSVGDFDLVRPVLADLGVQERFFRVAMKPGKPLTFGVHPGGALCFGLPGNPASSLVSFALFVRPALRRLLGHQDLEYPRAPVTLLGPLRPDAERRHFARARVTRRGGELVAEPLAHQGSGMLRSLVGVNALLDTPPGSAPLPTGAQVQALLFSGL